MPILWQEEDAKELNEATTIAQLGCMFVILLAALSIYGWYSLVSWLAK